jgi:hypothetical protein
VNFSLRRGPDIAALVSEAPLLDVAADARSRTRLVRQAALDIVNQFGIATLAGEDLI